MAHHQRSVSNATTATDISTDASSYADDEASVLSDPIDEETTIHPDTATEPEFNVDQLDQQLSRLDSEPRRGGYHRRVRSRKHNVSLAIDARATSELVKGLSGDLPRIESGTSLQAQYGGSELGDVQVRALEGSADNQDMAELEHMRGSCHSKAEGGRTFSPHRRAALELPPRASGSGSSHLDASLMTTSPTSPGGARLSSVFPRSGPGLDV